MSATEPHLESSRSWSVIAVGQAAEVVDDELLQPYPDGHLLRFVIDAQQIGKVPNVRAPLANRGGVPLSAWRALAVPLYRQRYRRIEVEIANVLHLTEAT